MAVAQDLEYLTGMYQRGLLTPEEFAEAKRAVLSTHSHQPTVRTDSERRLSGPTQLPKTKRPWRTPEKALAWFSVVALILGLVLTGRFAMSVTTQEASGGSGGASQPSNEAEFIFDLQQAAPAYVTYMKPEIAAVHGHQVCFDMGVAGTSAPDVVEKFGTVLELPRDVAVALVASAVVNFCPQQRAA